MTATLSSFWVGHLSPRHLVLLGPLLGTCSSVTSFCLMSCLYVSCRSVTSPSLGEGAFCRRHPMRAALSPLLTRAVCFRVSPMRAVWVLLLWWADYRGQSSRLGPALCRGCWLTGLSHEVSGCRTLGLLPAHRWVKPGPGVSASLLVDRARS